MKTFPDLTRKELYDLVWARPRSEIAAEFGISDVRLGKLCQEMNVPAPPRGYWANLIAGRRRRKFCKAPLSYTVAERINEDHAEFQASISDFDPSDFDQAVPPPPVFESSVEDAIERYKLLVQQVPVPRGSRGLHPIAQKFVTEDERLTQLSRQYSWEKPKFASQAGQKLLQGLNQLLWMWSDVGLKPRASGHRNIKMWVGYGGSGRSFEVTHTYQDEVRATRSRKGDSAGFQLWFDTESWERQSKKPALVFPAFTREVLRSTAMLIIDHWERSFRSSVNRHYEWKVSERREALKEAAEERERQRKREEAQQQAILDSRQRLLHDALTSVTRADQIRMLIRALDERMESYADDIPTLRHWRRWALAEADAIDPRLRSAEDWKDWIDQFQLGS